MIEVLQKNAWLISSGSLIVSLVSAYFTITNVRRSWKLTEQATFLKSERAILKPLLELSVDDFFTIETTVSGNNKRTVYKPYYSKLKNIIHGIPAQKLRNKELSIKIQELQEMQVDKLLRSTTAGYNTWINFGEELNEVILLTRQYLSEVN